MHWCLVDCDRRREETETEDDGETDARLEIYLEAPHHGDRYEGKEEVGRDVDGRVEDPDVLEDSGINAFRISVSIC